MYVGLHRHGSPDIPRPLPRLYGSSHGRGTWGGGVENAQLWSGTRTDKKRIGSQSQPNTLYTHQTMQPGSAPSATFSWGTHGRTQPKIAGGGGSPRFRRAFIKHPADDDDLASEKGHLLTKRALFSTIIGGTVGTALASPLFLLCHYCHRFSHTVFEWDTFIIFHGSLDVRLTSDTRLAV